MDARLVKIEPFPSKDKPTAYRGRKVAVVNGEKWATLEMHTRGSSGNYYTVHQIGSGNVVCHDNIDHRPVKLWSDKMHYRTAHAYEVHVSFEERLLRSVQGMIEDGQLVHPKVAAEIVKKANDKRHREMDEQKKKEEKRFVDRAYEALNRAATPELVARVVEAMRWAQSR